MYKDGYKSHINIKYYVISIIKKTMVTLYERYRRNKLRTMRDCYLHSVRTYKTSTVEHSLDYVVSGEAAI